MPLRHGVSPIAASSRNSPILSLPAERDTGNAQTTGYSRRACQVAQRSEDVLTSPTALLRTGNQTRVTLHQLPDGEGIRGYETGSSSSRQRCLTNKQTDRTDRCHRRPL